MNPEERNRFLDGVLWGMAFSAVLWSLIIFTWFMLTT